MTNKTLKWIIFALMHCLLSPITEAFDGGNHTAHYSITLPKNMKKTVMPWPQEMVEQHQLRVQSIPDTYAREDGNRAILLTILPLTLPPTSDSTRFKDKVYHHIYSAVVSMEAFFDPQGKPDTRQKVEQNIKSMPLGKNIVTFYDKSYFNRGAPFFGRTMIIPGPKKNNLIMADIYFVGYQQPSVAKQLKTIMSSLQTMQVNWLSS